MGVAGVRVLSLLARLPSALAVDRPWPSWGARLKCVLVLSFSGGFGGALHGYAVHTHCFSEIGDEWICDSIAHFGILALALGGAAGIAVALVQHLFLRVITGALFGFLGVAAAMRNVRENFWEGGLWMADDFPGGEPTAWAVYLGLPAGAVLTLLLHLAFRCAWKPRLGLCALLLALFLGAQSQDLLWDHWAPSCLRGMCGTANANTLEGYRSLAWRHGLSLTLSLYLGAQMLIVYVRAPTSRTPSRGPSAWPGRRG